VKPAAFIYSTEVTSSLLSHFDNAVVQKRDGVESWRWALNSIHIDGTRVPVEKPSIFGLMQHSNRIVIRFRHRRSRPAERHRDAEVPARLRLSAC